MAVVIMAMLVWFCYPVMAVYGRMERTMKETAIHLLGTEPGLQDLARAAFPSYHGKAFKVQVTDPATPINCASYWDGGSRDYFAFVDMGTMRSVQAPAQSAYDPHVLGLNAVTLAQCPPNVVIVEHTIFCGKDLGLTIYARAEAITPMLPAVVELSRWERIVLSATRSLKSSYNGISDYRLHEAQRETGITRDAWQMAKDVLITKGLLNKAGAITVAGKNAIGYTDLRELRGEK